MRISAAIAAVSLAGATLVGASLGLGLPAFGVQAPTLDRGGSVSSETTTRDVVAETELYCLTLAIYFEGGSTFEPEVGLRHIARVVTERAKEGRPYWGGDTVCGVVFHASRGVCQFSFACLPEARRTPRRNALWERSEEIARDALEGRNDDPDPMIRYYMNEPLSALKNACAFRKEFVPVVKAGRHEFFREATRAERKALAATNPEACQRYAAQLERAKAKAKAAKARAAKAAKSKVAKSKAAKAGKVAKVAKAAKVSKSRVAKVSAAKPKAVKAARASVKKARTARASKKKYTTASR